jgi:hypothetical protein
MSRQHGSDDSVSPGDDELPALPPEWAGLVVPDDPRELAAEAAQVRAELALEAGRRRRAARGGGFFGKRRWVRSGLSGPLVALILFVVAAVGSLMVVVLPKPQRIPRRAPLADTKVLIGQRNGLLPPAVLADGSRQEVLLRDYRPAVIVLSPAICTSCASVRNQTVATAGDTSLTVVWVTEGDHAVTPPGGTKSRTISLADPEPFVRPAIDGASETGPTVLLIRADGRIDKIFTQPVSMPPSKVDMAAMAGS